MSISKDQPGLSFDESIATHLEQVTKRSTNNFITKSSLFDHSPICATFTSETLPSCATFTSEILPTHTSDLDQDNEEAPEFITHYKP